jgi:hypothetical protein
MRHGDSSFGRNADNLATVRRHLSAPRFTVVDEMANDAPSLRIRTDELRTVREAMRDFGSLLAELDEGEVEKLVLTQRNRVRAVVVSVERWSQLERALDGDGTQGQGNRQS